MQKKGDYTLISSFSTPSGIDVNGGYAITKHLAIIGGFNFYRNKDNEERFSIFSTIRESSALTYKHSGFHFGAGGYLPISKDKESVFLAFFGGVVKNKFYMLESLYEMTPTPTLPKLNFYKSDINKLFLQGSVNFYQKRFQASFTTRFNYAGYNNVDTDYDSNQQYSYQLPPYKYPKWSSFLDLSFDAKYFFNKNQSLGIGAFFITTTRLNRKDFNFYYYPFRLGAGIVVKSPFADKHLKK